VTPGGLLRCADVAVLFGVSAKTVTRWSRAGRLPCIRTLGGHRRYQADVVLRVLAEHTENA
jgi:excisionase family DNA binding protein